MHDFDRRFVHTFGKEALEFAWRITSNNNGCVMVTMVVDLRASCVHMFSEVATDHLNQFN